MEASGALWKEESKRLKNELNRTMGCCELFQKLQNRNAAQFTPLTNSSRNNNNEDYSDAKVSQERSIAKITDHPHQHMNLKVLHDDIVKNVRTFFGNLAPYAHL